MMDPTKQLAGSCRAVSMSTSMWVTVAAIRSDRSPVCRRSLCCCFAPDSDGRGLLFLDLKIRFLFWRNWKYLNLFVECTCLDDIVNMFNSQHA